MSAQPLNPNDPIALEDARGWATAGDAEMLERNYTTGAMLYSAATAWALISIAESVGEAGRAKDIAQTEILLDKLQDGEGRLRERIRGLERENAALHAAAVPPEKPPT